MIQNSNPKKIKYSCRSKYTRIFGNGNGNISYSRYSKISDSQYG